jgi:hypothetical protein
MLCENINFRIIFGVCCIKAADGRLLSSTCQDFDAFDSQGLKGLKKPFAEAQKKGEHGHPNE